jgi:hypothetical protein
VLTVLRTYFLVAQPLVAASVADIKRTIESFCMCFLSSESPDRSPARIRNKQDVYRLRKTPGAAE